MKCRRCGNEVEQGDKFCSACGARIEPGVKTIQLKCKECGGVMDWNDNRPILYCSYCGSKELILESDDVTIQRIKTDAFKEVAFKELNNVAEWKRHQELREEKQAKEAEYKKFAEGPLSTLLAMLFFIFLVVAISSFSNNYILNGFVASCQTVLCGLAWLIGMQFIHVSTPRLHVLLTAIAFVLIVFYLYLFFYFQGYNNAVGEYVGDYINAVG